MTKLQYANLQFGYDPDNPKHKAWLQQLKELVANMPEGMEKWQSDGMQPRKVRLAELVAYLHDTGFTSSARRRDARNMWRTLAILCGVTVPEEASCVEPIELELLDVKRITASRLKRLQLREGVQSGRLLEFIALLR